LLKRRTERVIVLLKINKRWFRKSRMIIRINRMISNKRSRRVNWRFRFRMNKSKRISSKTICCKNSQKRKLKTWKTKVRFRILKF